MMRARLPLFASVCLLLSLLVLMSSVEAKKKKYVGETGGDFEFIDEVSPKWLSTRLSACHPIQLSCLSVCVCVYVGVRVCVLVPACACAVWHI